MARLQPAGASEDASKLGTGKIRIPEDASPGDDETQRIDCAGGIVEAKRVQLHANVDQYSVAAACLDLQYHLEFRAQVLAEHFSGPELESPEIEKITQIEGGQTAAFDF